MKHLVSLMAVFLLMGCQTTDITPKDTTSPTKIETDEKLAEESQQILPKKDEKLNVPLTGAVVSHKPILCGPSDVFLKGIEKTSQENPIGFWTDSAHGNRVLLLHNGETETVTILEYPRPDVACFLSVGINSKFKFLPQTKGTSIIYKKVLD
jgi:hypothetical protein